MQMRHSPLPLAALLGAALSILPGCESTKSSGPSPSDTQAQNPASVQAQDDWQRARVGDRVTYSFSATQGPEPRGGGGTARTLKGLVTLEVVSVQQPWVWVRLAYTDEAGKPLSQTRLAQEQLIPVRADVTRPIDVPHQGEATAERPSVAGRTWEAMRYVSDQRPVDGPLRTRVYANEPGPLYLTHGLIDASTESAGFHVPGGIQLTLREFREGSASTSAPVPALERPLGPGAYYDRRVDVVGPSPSVQRSCFAAERGYLLRTEGPIDTNAPACSDFSQAEPEPLEEVLTELTFGALSEGDWPPAAAASGSRGTFTAEDRNVPALTEQHTENVERIQRVSSETYAAEPWAPALAGLPYEARFQPLSSDTERVLAGGKRESEGGVRLVRWGSWLGGQK
ncbi:DUF6068 family protein [Vitiosangium sp. GDMCC 1.1324]|uniref:DUF6068 family protein n=1 Tax=Vitiosangium sp. (strain GDMCC 1.1324) TaxID=2138576 RepID=UPI000D3ACB10|nr:DUF6068 family protein [Vitiosangium sp. GDMCC 1.1324]PTL79959.1 hypothetical protein DAT35_31555 [Vitiosangium sp. GDMCC 1.1324]